LGSVLHKFRPRCKSTYMQGIGSMSESRWALLCLLVLGILDAATAHGSIAKPVSKNEMAFQLRAFNTFPEGMPDDFRYEPWTSAHGNLAGQTGTAPGNSCGASQAEYAQGLSTWQKWYDISGTPVPVLVPGAELEVLARITADHGGQSWFMIACGDVINDDLDWTILQRSSRDRHHHYMPNNPSIFAWQTGELTKTAGGILAAHWNVPALFSCPTRHAVGRWVWKTGNTCNDVHNVGRKTETFKFNEFASVVHAYEPSAHVQPACTVPPEIFISCVDFVVGGDSEPSPSTPAPAPDDDPVPAPSTSSVAPTPAPDGDCTDHALTGAWSGGGAHTCATYHAHGGSAYCAHALLSEACCFCGGGSSSAAPVPTPTDACTDHALTGAWSGGGTYKCATYLDHGGLAYCSHEELHSACCFCGGGSSSPATPAPAPTTSPQVLAPTTSSQPGGQQPATCVSRQVLECINGASSYWPKCNAAQSKDVAGPAGYEFGHYCTQEWTDALNEMLHDPVVDKCVDTDAVHKFLAQVAHETGYFSTVFQPTDGGAGLIHMIPGNWERNALDMDGLWPGHGYAPKVSVMGKTFFQTPAYGWRSVAAWFKRTSEVIPGCGVDLFDQPFETQTRCIFGQANNRNEAFNIVGRCLKSPASAKTQGLFEAKPGSVVHDHGNLLVEARGAGHGAAVCLAAIGALVALLGFSAASRKRRASPHYSRQGLAVPGAEDDDLI